MRISAIYQLHESKAVRYTPLSLGAVFRGSSAVEQPTVNRLVVGSIPTRGASPERFYEMRPYVAHFSYLHPAPL